MVTIEDWSDSIYRGFIEGYYGIPWTTDERIELMRFGGDFKTNVYIYAPKTTRITVRTGVRCIRSGFTRNKRTGKSGRTN